MSARYRQLRLYLVVGPAETVLRQCSEESSRAYHHGRHVDRVPVSIPSRNSTMATRPVDSPHPSLRVSDMALSRLVHLSLQLSRRIDVQNAIYRQKLRMDKAEEEESERCTPRVLLARCRNRTLAGKAAADGWQRQGWRRRQREAGSVSETPRGFLSAEIEMPNAQCSMPMFLKNAPPPTPRQPRQWQDKETGIEGKDGFRNAMPRKEEHTSHRAALFASASSPLYQDHELEPIAAART